MQHEHLLNLTCRPPRPPLHSGIEPKTYVHRVDQGTNPFISYPGFYPLHPNPHWFYPFHLAPFCPTIYPLLVLVWELFSSLWRITGAIPENYTPYEGPKVPSRKLDGAILESLFHLYTPYEGPKVANQNNRKLEGNHSLFSSYFDEYQRVMMY